MTEFEVAAILITLTAGLAYFNARVLRLPSAIGRMATALVGSLIVLVLDQAQALAPSVSRSSCRSSPKGDSRGSSTA